MVERYVRDVEAVCSNHITSTTRLNLDAIRVPGSVFYFVSSLAFIVEYLFVNASHTCGEQFAHRRFFYFWLLCLRLRRVSFLSTLSK